MLLKYWKEAITIVVIIISLLAIWSYADKHVFKPKRDLIVCVEDVSIKDIEYSNLKEAIAALNASTRMIESNAFNSGYNRGLIDANKTNDNNGSICFTPLF